MENISHESVLVLLIRVILGILFFFQGYDKLFKVKITGVIAFFEEEMKGKNVPRFILTSSAYFTSYVEFFCGGLVILGLFKTTALYLLGFDLVLVCGAFSMLKPMWDMQLLFPRLILLAASLFFPTNWDVISFDHLIKPWIH